MTQTRLNEWITAYPASQPTRLRLFCFPYAGGGTAAFRDWNNALPAWIQLCPVLLPGRESRFNEALYSDFDILIKALAGAITPWLDLPFAFFGHSLGALVSFELARELRRRSGVAPRRLFVSGCRAPQLAPYRADLHKLPRAEFIEQLRRFEGTPEEVFQHNELLELVLPILRTDFALFSSYVYRQDEPLKCGITAFGGRQDSKAPQADIALWREQTSTSFSLQMVDGGHFFIFKAREVFLRMLANQLMPLG